MRIWNSHSNFALPPAGVITKQDLSHFINESFTVFPATTEGCTLMTADDRYDRR